MWLKPSAEQQFLYGHNVLKSGLGRISENTKKYDGVVIYSMNDLPLVRVDANFNLVLVKTKIICSFFNVLGIWCRR